MLALALLPWTGSVAAQSMRPFGTFRQLHGETRLNARLEYAAGTLRVGPGGPGDLYRMDLTYDENRFLPVSDFDASRADVVLGLRTAGVGGIRVVSKDQLKQAAGVTFSPSVDLTLDINLGAADADLEMGGLRVADLGIKTGASRTVLRFSRPNRTRCRSVELSAGAAELSVLGLGNSRCDRIDFEGGMGKVTLDFGGAWSSSAKADVRMAMGEVTLRLPRRVGVKLTLDRFLSSFEPAGLVRRGNSFLSPNYERTDRHLDITLTAAVGGVRVEWEK
ncbi:MAG: hypothetical protein ACREMX_10180 [Gemmatimonadales bacterium]